MKRLGLVGEAELGDDLAGGGVADDLLRERRPVGEQVAQQSQRGRGVVEEPQSVRRARESMPSAPTRAVFGMVFSALTVRTAYGPGFTSPATSDREFLDTVIDMAGRYLVRT